VNASTREWLGLHQWSYLDWSIHSLQPDSQATWLCIQISGPSCDPLLWISEDSFTAMDQWR